MQNLLLDRYLALNVTAIRLLLLKLVAAELAEMQQCVVLAVALCAGGPTTGHATVAWSQAANTERCGFH